MHAMFILTRIKLSVLFLSALFLAPLLFFYVNDVPPNANSITKLLTLTLVNKTFIFAETGENQL